MEAVEGWKHDMARHGHNGVAEYCDVGGLEVS